MAPPKYIGVVLQTVAGTGEVVCTVVLQSDRFVLADLAAMNKASELGKAGVKCIPAVYRLDG